MRAGLLTLMVVMMYFGLSGLAQISIATPALGHPDGRQAHIRLAESATTCSASQARLSASMMLRRNRIACTILGPSSPPDSAGHIIIAGDKKTMRAWRLSSTASTVAKSCRQGRWACAGR